MDASVQAVGGLRIDVVAVQDQAAEARLDVGARAAETVVEIEMAEGGVEIVSPEQVDDAAAEPHAFRIAGRSAHRALGFGELIDLLRLFCLLLPGRRRLLKEQLRSGFTNPEYSGYSSEGLGGVRCVPGSQHGAETLVTARRSTSS